MKNLFRYFLCFSIILNYGCNQGSNNKRDTLINKVSNSYQDSVPKDSLIDDNKSLEQDTASLSETTTTEPVKDQDNEVVPSVGVNYGRLINETPGHSIKLEIDTNRPQEITLSVLQEPFKISSLKDTMRVRMFNYTTDTLTTGLYYRVEVYKTKQWMLVAPPKGNAFFEDLGFMLRPYEACDFLIRLYPDRVYYQAGKYRVVKDYLLLDFIKTKKRYEIVATFEMEE